MAAEVRKAKRAYLRWLKNCLAYFMWYKYLLVFLGAMLFDITPFPLPPAFTVMIFLQITFDLKIWPVIILGVLGSIIGRLILTLYIPKVSAKIFNRKKNEDVQFLGKKMKENGWKGQLYIVLYSLLPLPTTPLFVAAGMAKMHPVYVIPAFFIGKFTSDTIAVLSGKYASENADEIIEGIASWQSIAGLAGCVLLISALLFIDWRELMQKKKFRMKFKIWK
jgi:membrane protein DedA with SNARE-associated domain